MDKFVRFQGSNPTFLMPAEAATDIYQPQAKFFTVVDALKGYLDEEIHLLLRGLETHGNWWRYPPCGEETDFRFTNVYYWYILGFLAVLK